MKHDTTLTWNWLRMNVPTIVVLLGAFLFVNNSLLKGQEKTESLTESVNGIKAIVEPVGLMQHRLTRAEDSIKEAHARIDSLSNTMINNIDLIRRDVNRLTTQVEVLSSQIGMVLGEERIPVQRRARPGGPIKVE